ncbi:MAG TPA: cytochrome c3 family protein [Candidatus Methanoperedens sp.]
MNKSLSVLILAAFLLVVSGSVAFATVYPSYNNATDCRGCHGSDNSTTIPTPATRHHMLAVKGLFQCQDCHPVLFDNSTGTYSTQVIRDCEVCHPGKNHTQIHHILVSQGLFQCQDCHPVIYDNSTQSYTTKVTWDCPVCHSTVLSIQNTTPAPTPTPPPLPAGPTITSFIPISPLNNIVNDSRTFEITTDQIVNVTWLINDSQVQFNESVTDAGYTNTGASLGTWNVSAVASNINGTVMYNWSWKVTSTPLMVPPTIAGYVPISSQVNDTANTGVYRKFGIAADQTANMTWYLNGSQVQFDEKVTQSVYNNTNVLPGVWNVSAVASNSNGTVQHNWTWNVAFPPPTIISAYPFSPVNDFGGASRTFSVATDQTANITWFINNSQVQFNESVNGANYTNMSASIGIWYVNAMVSNNNGAVQYNWVWNVTAVPFPSIINFYPTSPVNDVTGNLRTFNITVNQTSNVTWLINGTQVQSNSSVTGASYTSTSASLGIWNVSAIAANPYGSDMHTWIWNVTRSPETPAGSHSAIDCSICHAQLRSEQICYQCHNNSKNSANGTNIYVQFTMSNDTFPGMGINKGYYNTVNTRHDITASDQNYSFTKLECTDCHSAHNASGQNVVIDADTGTSFNKTMIHPGTGQVILDYVTYCLKCHDNTWSPNVTGPSIITNISYVYFNLNTSNKGDWHGATGGDKYNNSFLIGPYLSQKGRSYVPAMPCNDCHDSHGSGNLYSLKTLTDQYGVNINITSQNINNSDVAHWCSHCHKDPMQQNTSTQTKGNCLTSKCHSHGKRF